MLSPESIKGLTMSVRFCWQGDFLFKHYFLRIFETSCTGAASVLGLPPFPFSVRYFPSGFLESRPLLYLIENILFGRAVFIYSKVTKGNQSQNGDLWQITRKYRKRDISTSPHILRCSASRWSSVVGKGGLVKSQTVYSEARETDWNINIEWARFEAEIAEKCYPGIRFYSYAAPRGSVGSEWTGWHEWRWNGLACDWNCVG